MPPIDSTMPFKDTAAERHRVDVEVSPSVVTRMLLKAGEGDESNPDGAFINTNSAA